MFICAGYFLLERNHNQELRLISSENRSGVVKISLVLSLINLKGGFFRSGFYSKDALLDCDLGVRNILI